jgi:hypothetical protein
VPVTHTDRSQGAANDVMATGRRDDHAP